MKRLWILLFISLPMFFIEGCSGAFTQVVEHIGMNNTELNSRTTSLLPNGHVIINANLIHSKDWFACSPPDKYFKRFIVGSPEVVRADLDKANVVTMSNGHKRYILEKVQVGTKTTEWKMYPDTLQKRDASESDLPFSLGETEKSEFKGELPYPIDGETKHLYIGRLCLNEHPGEYTRWWHYPPQILLIPALAIDIVTYPFQIYYVLCQASIHS